MALEVSPSSMAEIKPFSAVPNALLLLLLLLLASVELAEEREVKSEVLCRLVDSIAESSFRRCHSPEVRSPLSSRCFFI